MRHASLITAGAVMAIAAASGRAAAPQTTVRNQATCDSLTGLAIPAASIGLPTTGATIARRGSRRRVAADGRRRSRGPGDPGVLQGHRQHRAGRSDRAADQLPRQPADVVEPQDRADGRQRQQRRDSGRADDRHAVGARVDSAERAVRAVARIRRLRQRLGPSDGAGEAPPAAARRRRRRLDDERRGADQLRVRADEEDARRRRSRSSRSSTASRSGAVITSARRRAGARR